MRVVEKFVSINGEGIRQGQLSVFIRFAFCILRCIYCDTLYSLINPNYEEESIDKLIEYILSTGVKNVTLTGGEPLIQPEIGKLLYQEYFSGVIRTEQDFLARLQELEAV